MKTREINTALVILFLLMSIWDIGITYHFYQQDPITFLHAEGNYLMTLGLKNNIPFFFSPAILLNFGLIGYFYFKRRDIYLFSKSKWNGFWYVFIPLGMLGHFLGGSSWLLFT